MTSKLKKIKMCNIVAFVGSFLFFGILFTYAFITTYSSDDYQYSTFLDSGIHEWMKMMQNHYQTINGRTFVHLIATAVLHFKNIVFAIVFSISVFTIMLCFREKFIDKKYFYILFFGGLVLTPRPIMVEGVLWISGFCNYVLPTAMTALLFYWSRNMLCKNSFTWEKVAFLLILSFLSGATTEQSGIAVCVLLILLFFEAVSNHNTSYVKICFVQTILALAGVVSIFLSPATQSRMGSEINISFIRIITLSLSEQKALILKSPALIILITLLPVLLFINTYRKKGTVIIGINCVLIEIYVFLITVTDSIFSAYCYGILLLLLLSLSIICWFLLSRTIGSLMCYAVLTVIIMLPTQSSVYRIFFPMYTIFLSLVCSLFCNEQSGLVRHSVLSKFCVLILVLISMGTAVHDLPHYFYNHKIDVMNTEYEEQAKYSGVLYYCMDYDEEYTHTKAYNDGYIYSTFLSSTGSPSNQTVYFYSKELPVIFVNNNRITSPAIKDDFGNFLVPLRDVIENLGGTINWNRKNEIEIIMNKITYQLFKTEKGYELSYQNDNGFLYEDIPVSLSKSYYSIMLPVNFYRNILDTEVTVSDSKIYINSKNY